MEKACICRPFPLDVHCWSAITWRLASARFWLIITNVDRKIASSETIHRQQPKGVLLHAEADPRGKPDHVDVQERHPAGERRDRVAARFYVAAARSSTCLASAGLLGCGSFGVAPSRMSFRQ
jgi:hypothetical protein